MTSTITTKFIINIWLLTLTLTSAGIFVKADSSIPHLCDNVKCPQVSEMVCPADSDIRELIPEPLIAEGDYSNEINNVNISEEVYAQCCLTQKCICKTCYITDCDQDGEVVVELAPESMDTPGHCCGKHECQREPNCTEVQNTENYWLTDCQRCKCYSGQRICHQSCDELNKKEAFCHWKNLNQFFQHGDTWKDGCQECKCNNGLANCVINFCRAVNCPAHRQVMLKDSCCPVCWPKGFAMPHDDVEYDDDNVESGHNYDDDDNGHDYNDVEEPNVTLKPLLEEGLMTKTETTNSNSTLQNATVAAITTSTTAATTTSTEAVASSSISAETTENIVYSSSATVLLQETVIDNINSTPCQNAGLASADYSYSSTTSQPCAQQSDQIYPKVVEVIQHTQHNYILYIIIAGLTVAVVLLIVWVVCLKVKAKRYRPVAIFDDNFNTMSKIKVKKTSELNLGSTKNGKIAAYSEVMP